MELTYRKVRPGRHAIHLHLVHGAVVTLGFIERVEQCRSIVWVTTFDIDLPFPTDSFGDRSLEAAKRRIATRLFVHLIGDLATPHRRTPNE